MRQIQRNAPAGLSSAELATTETGSVLIAENALEARVASMLRLTHFVLVGEDKLVSFLFPQLMAKLISQCRPWTKRDTVLIDECMPLNNFSTAGQFICTIFVLNDPCAMLP